MKCSNCGRVISDDSQFCEYCGTKLTKDSATITFKEAISFCFHKYATFSGRASRAEYWWFFFFNFLVSFFVLWFDMEAGTIFGFFVILFFFLPALSVAVRRCHDTNHSGWWLLFPIYNIILMFMKGDKVENDYGAA